MPKTTAHKKTLIKRKLAVPSPSHPVAHSLHIKQTHDLMASKCWAEQCWGQTPNQGSGPPTTSAGLPVCKICIQCVCVCAKYLLFIFMGWQCVILYTHTHTSLCLFTFILHIFCYQFKLACESLGVGNIDEVLISFYESLNSSHTFTTASDETRAHTCTELHVWVRFVQPCVTMHSVAVMIAWAFMWTTAYCPHMSLAQTDNDIDWYVKQSHLKPSTPPRLPCDLVLFYIYNRLCLWLRATEAKTVCPVRDVSMWVMCACVWGGVVLSPLSLTSPPHHPPGQDPLHLFTLLSDLKPRGQKKI